MKLYDVADRFKYLDVFYTIFAAPKVMDKVFIKTYNPNTISIINAVADASREEVNETA